MGLCVFCNKKIKQFTTTTDWKKRQLHKGCYKILQEEQALAFSLENYVNGN